MKECVVKLNYALIFNFYNKILTAVDIFRSDIKSCFMNNDTTPPPGLWMEISLDSLGFWSCKYPLESETPSWCEMLRGQVLAGRGVRTQFT